MGLRTPTTLNSAQMSLSLEFNKYPSDSFGPGLFITIGKTLDHVVSPSVYLDVLACYR